MRIFLLGYMGSGKSTIGKKLASKLNLDYIDLDDLFESKFKLSIADFFEKYDEASFRRIESELLESMISYENVVISTGGGTPCFNQNMDFMLRNGLSLYIKMSTQSLYHRLTNAKRVRPLLKAYVGEDLKQFITSQLKEREVWYLKADIEIRGENFDFENCLQLIKSHSKFQ